MKLVCLPSVLALCLLAGSCREKIAATGAQIDRLSSTYLLPGATVLTGANVGELKKTALYARYSDRLNFPGLNESSDKLGFDPRHDVDTLLLESDSRRSLVLATGDLKADTIRQKLGGLSARKVAYKKYTLFGDDKNMLALPGNRLVLAGSAEAVRASLDAHDAGSGEIPPALASRLQTIPHSAQIWIVSSKGLPFAELPMRSDVQSALSNIVAYISGTTAGAQVSDGLLASIRLDCISTAGAQRVHDAIRGGIGLARLSTRDDQSDLLRLYDAIEVNQTGDVVQVRAQLNATEIDKLVTLLPQVTNRAAPLLR